MRVGGSQQCMERLGKAENKSALNSSFSSVVVCADEVSIEVVSRIKVILDAITPEKKHMLQQVQGLK